MSSARTPSSNHADDAPFDVGVEGTLAEDTNALQDVVLPTINISADRRAVPQQNTKTFITPRRTPVALNPEIKFAYRRPSAAFPPPQLPFKPTRRYTPRFIPARFIRATYRLYVSSDISQDVAQSWSVNPNKFVDWSLVRKVDILTEKSLDQLTCPICLENALVAPRLTQCGHVFCFPCILRCCIDIETMSRLRKPKCPVCGEVMSIDTLKPARFQPVSIPRPGAWATFCLMCRDAGATYADVVGLLNSASSNSLDAFSKLGQHRFSFSNERAAYFQRIVLIHHSDTTLKDDALSLRAFRSHLLAESGLVDPDILAMVDLCLELLQEKSERESFRDALNSHETAVSLAPAECHSLFNSTPYNPADLVSLLEPSRFTTSDLSSFSQPLCYYQIVDGQFCFLDDLCYQCLLEAARQRHCDDQSDGAETKLPCILSRVKVTRVDELRVDLDFKHLYPKLGHLPLTSTVRIVEVDVRPLVPPRIWAVFAPQFQKRRQARAVSERHRRRVQRREAPNRASINGKAVNTQPAVVEEVLNDVIDPPSTKDLSSSLSFPPLDSTLPSRCVSPSGDAAATTDLRATSWVNHLSVNHNVRRRNELFPTLDESISGIGRSSPPFRKQQPIVTPSQSGRKPPIKAVHIQNIP